MMADLDGIGYLKGSALLNSVVLLLILSPLGPIFGFEEGPIPSDQVRSGEGSVIDVKMADEVVVPFGGTKCEVAISIEELSGVDATIDGITVKFYPNDMNSIFKVQRSTGLGISIPGNQAISHSFWLELPENASVLSARKGDDRMRAQIELKGCDENGNQFDISDWVEIAFTHKVAVLVQEDIYGIVENKLLRYEDDVRSDNNVEFVNVHDHWETPESIREVLVTLWKEQGISGSIIVGDFPLPTWELWREGKQDELCFIPIFYEDMDGSFLDNDSNGIYNKHYWGENDGPEIWTSFLTPPSQSIPSDCLMAQGSGSSGGLKGSYYRGEDFTDPILTRIDNEIFFDWGAVYPPNPVPAESASVEWEGKIFVDKKENLTLEIICGGGLILEVDGKRTINEPDTPFHFWRTLRSTGELDSGWHNVDIRFLTNGGPGYIRLCWRSDGIVGDLMNGWFDRDHSYRTGEIPVPKRGHLFVEESYEGLREDLKKSYMEPLFGTNFDCPGGKPLAPEYFSALSDGHELTWVWSHSCPSAHCIDPDVQSYSLMGKNGSVVTLIWGCHAGDFSEVESYAAKTTNLVINYAFSTNFGLAAAGCGRSQGTGYEQVLTDWSEGSTLGLGYFHFCDIGNNRTMRMSETHDLGAEMWVENEVLVGDPFIKINHKPSRPHVEIGNGSMFGSGPEIPVSIESEGATQMKLSCNGEMTDWIPFEETISLPITDEGPLEIRVWTRNSYGMNPYFDLDKVRIDYDPPILEGLSINGGAEYANRSAVTLSLRYSGDLSGGETISFSNDGSAWSAWETAIPEKEWNLLEGDGQRSVWARVRDRSGGIGRTVTGSIEVDGTPPTTDLIASGTEKQNGWYGGAVTVTMVGHDAHLAGTMYRIGGGEWVEYDHEFVMSQEGATEIRYASTDEAGNREAEKSNSVRIDETRPYDLVLGIEDRYVNDPNLRVHVDAKDDVSGPSSLSFSSNGYVWEPWRDFEPEVSYTIDHEGMNEIFLRVKDAAGNINWTEDPLIVYLDSIKPVLVSHEPPDGGSIDRGGGVVLVFSEEVQILPREILIEDEAGETIDFDLEEIGVGRYSLVTDWKGYSHYTVNISGHIGDLAGNRMGDGEEFSFEIEGIPPDPPRNLHGEAVDGKVVLSWDAPHRKGDLDVIGYRILRNGSDLGTVNGTSFVDESVFPGSEYSYRVIPFNIVEDGLPSEEIAVRIPPEILKEQGSDGSYLIPMIGIITILSVLIVAGYILFHKRSKLDEE